MASSMTPVLPAPVGAEMTCSVQICGRFVKLPSVVDAPYLLR